MKLLKAFRTGNLLMIVLTMLAMRYCVIGALLKIDNFELALPLWAFILLIAAVLFIATAGYIINDYFDIHTDAENNKLNIVNLYFKDKERAINVFAILSMLGIIAGGIVSWYIGFIKFTIIFFLASSLLWLYASNFKGVALIGNLIVSLLTAMVPMLVAVFEVPALNAKYADILLKVGGNFMILVYWVAAFAVFAFLLSMSREIVKDIEDYEGDIKSGIATLPVVAGKKISAVVAILFIIAVLVLLVLAYLWYALNVTISLYYLVGAVSIPLFFAIFKLLFARDKKDYHIISLTLKGVMLTGIGYSVVACYIFSKF